MARMCFAENRTRSDVTVTRNHSRALRPKAQMIRTKIQFIALVYGVIIATTSGYVIGIEG